jgi:hypothetical protein
VYGIQILETVGFAEQCPITVSISLVAQNYNDFQVNFL